ncbi:MAG: hypothetical protein ACHQNV_00720 [Vicinamibacteria bacterium]
MEGIVDEAVFRRIVRTARGEPGPVYGKTGKRQLLDRLPGYNNAARFSPWLVLVDLDHDADCTPPFRAATLAAPSEQMCFRVAVREVEAWLLADHQRIAEFLDVNPHWLPRDPESEPDPKQVVVNLARRSRSRDIRRDLVPRVGSGRSEGPAYSSRLIEFVSDRTYGWRPTVAARSSDSLARCLRSVRRLVRTASGAVRP